MPRKSSTSSRVYRDLTTLGAGGMAKVYRARQESLDRDVAIKELKADLARDPSIVARFEREARYAANLQHESIVHVYDYFKEGNSYYIVMEYVDGTDLGRIVKQVGPLPPEIAAVLAMRIARALEHAHGRGLIHRDIKPANVLISRNGEVKLSDFGIAKDPTNPNDNMTRTGQAVGTPSYMSPEQILGDPIDFRSDLFSLGIVLYELMTGIKPFMADTAAALLEKIRTQGYRDVRRVTGATPRALAKVIRRCLKKEPKKRWSSTSELRAAIESWILPRLRVSPDEALKTWLLKSGVFSETGTKVVDAGAGSIANLAGRTTTTKSWRPRLIAAGIACAGIATVALFPRTIGDLVTHHGKPTPVATPSHHGGMVTGTNGAANR